MNHVKLIFLIVFILFCNGGVQAQTDSVVQQATDIPVKYFHQVDKTVSCYSARISAKTEKTLDKLVRWENKIKIILQRANPTTAEALFANKDLTFAGLQEKLHQGMQIARKYEAQYGDYRNKLDKGLGQITQSTQQADSLLKLRAALLSNKLDTLDDRLQQSEAIAQFIRQRKKQLLAQALPYIGKSKYLSKISKESYYYAETLRNYKEIFSDGKKAEEAAMKILKKIPAFAKLFKGGSASPVPLAPASYAPAVNIPGLQTRNSMNSLLQGRVSGGGGNAAQLISSRISAAQATLSSLRGKILKNGSGTGADDLPDFKPNSQRSKTFGQRLEKGFNIQSVKSSSLLPNVTDIAATLGYKLNDKSIVGLGLSYKLGLGSIQRIRFSHEGLGFRSYIDWKISFTRRETKAGLFVSGGFEMNYLHSFSKLSQLNHTASWQKSGLIGISKKLPLKTKFTKETKVQLLYDMLYREHIPVSQPWVFRFGYTL